MNQEAYIVRDLNGTVTLDKCTRYIVELVFVVALSSTKGAQEEELCIMVKRCQGGKESVKLILPKNLLWRMKVCTPVFTPLNNIYFIDGEELPRDDIYVVDLSIVVAFLIGCCSATTGE
mmetsp:Transcript_37195/g.55647  ORF Transcript_37195/g.55647 Transcript_37195/m.55647 type:complete len:119 (+) Transcript_37195:902-1258(+)